MKPEDLIPTATEQGGILRQTRNGATHFGTSDVRDLSGGVLPCTVVRVSVSRRTGEVFIRESYNVRTEKQRARRVKECQKGWSCGWDAHVEIRPLGEEAQ